MHPRNTPKPTARDRVSMDPDTSKSETWRALYNAKGKNIRRQSRGNPHFRNSRVKNLKHFLCLSFGRLDKQDKTKNNNMKNMDKKTISRQFSKKRVVVSELVDG
mmetsp:Transcript_45371/g.52187  ORF Transcript_45371/g.52187 Transcript_45371/m.52187 type:complete len:104 (-) Transcript_45371:318-629(-)